MKLYEISRALVFNKLYLSLCSPALEHSKLRKYLLDTRKCSEDIVEKFDLRFKDFESVFLKSLDSSEYEFAKELGLIAEDEETGELRDRFQNCIVFPYSVPNFGDIAFGFRKLGEKLYVNSSRSIVFTKDWSFYGLAQAIPEILKTDWIIIVEGYFDVLRMHMLGFTNTVGVAGTGVSALRASAIRRLANNFLLLFDSDEAGEDAKMRTKKRLKYLGAHVVALGLPSAKKHDPDSFGLKYPDKLTTKVQEIING